ncbi:MAG: hypothetical protein ACK4IY_01615, partial [Chitinophagales bacterium]
FGSLLFNFYRINGHNPIQSNWEVLHYAALTVPYLSEGAVRQLSGSLKNECDYTVQSVSKMLYPNTEKYFPVQESISDGIQKDQFIEKHFYHANTFLRVQEGKLHILENVLESKKIHFKKLSSKTLVCAGNFPLTDLPEYTQGIFEIQDIASQSVAAFLHPAANEVWWDCCCGSGGKSILLLEKERDIQLYASDVRESILNNFQMRMQRNNYGKVNIVQADLENTNCNISVIPGCDGIIADVPCSGSGTWGRTPEWLHFFNADLLKTYSARQRRIVKTILTKLKRGGVLVYLTCSVFKEENEKNISFFTDTMPLQLKQMQYLQYSDLKADTLFLAELIKV